MLLRASRQCAHEVVQASEHRPVDGLRDRRREMPGRIELAAESCTARVLEELAVVQPRVVVVMGEPALDELNALGMPGGAQLEPLAGEIQRWTIHCEALFTPDLDECLDDEAAKRRFWTAFKRLGDWHGELPPY